MKHFLLSIAVFSFAVFSAITYQSCSKDECESVSCQHGGTCSSGKCVCPTGYSGVHCESRTCEVNSTALVQFSNRSANSTYSVLWDGSIITTLSAGVTSDFFTVAAGQHNLEFRYSNSSTSSCTPSTPNLAQCSATVYWCSN
jgi:hypothetical protein